MMRYIGAFALFLLLTPIAGFAASKEQMEMQRDVAQLQDQVRTLQSGFDQQMSMLKTLVEQALEAGNKANTGVSVLTNNVTQTLDRELKDALRPVAGLTAKVDNANNDLSEVKNSMADLTTQMNKLQQQLSDINNAIKVIQAPPAAPPPSNVNPDVPGAATSHGVPPSAKAIFDGASSDYSSGKSDLAAGEFADFVRLYPDDPRAPDAQFYVGLTHYGQQKYDQAAMDFDVVLERFPENSRTPDAYFMKGKALKSGGQRDAAATVWRTLIKKYPRSDAATQATDQLKAMGLRPTTTTTSRKK
jgi:tol-pal system protein YbgF